MNPYILQDVQQIRAICQQLIQSEQRTAQQLSQQPGLQSVAQQESFNAQQLHQVISLASRLEQSLVQFQSQPIQPQFSQPYVTSPWGQAHVNPAALDTVMRAAPPAPGTF